MSNTNCGLSSQQARQRLLQYGANQLPETRHVSLLRIFISQFKSPFIYVLLVAALVSLGLNQIINCLFILLVLLLNASIGTAQEYAAERAASSLKKMVPHKTAVIRDGKRRIINASEIVPGDIVLLSSGDKVPADLKLLQTMSLQIDESMLTGESISTHKDEAFIGQVEMPLGDRLDLAYAGTVVQSGRAYGEVISTGARTEIGKIAADVTNKEAPPPLIQRIHQFTMRITYAMLILIAVIFIITVARGDDISTVFMLGVALAVSAIPEGLPVAITVALAIGMKRMAKAGVIIRKLVAVESLGSCTYIASDKTGTLTVNELTVRQIILANGSHYTISGEGQNAQGVITPVNQPEIQISDNKGTIETLLTAGTLSNEASRHDDESSGYTGDHVDIALLVLMEKIGTGINETRKRYKEIASIPYESHNAFSASFNQGETNIELFVKGSVERLIQMSTQTAGTKDFNENNILSYAEKLAADGYRVLGLAHRKIDNLNQDLTKHLKDLEFIGMIAMIDPLRPEVITAVKQCREGGIKVGMITGDHPLTAQVLAKELGIARSSITRDADKAVSGLQLKQAKSAGEEQFNQLVDSTRVFARVEPHQKMQIVESLINQGEFVAVTGDGVNDAPALKHAHVGIAMGKRGTDVARENSDLILTDDNFSSIVEGVKQGRIVYNNIRKVIFLLISTGAAEITLVLLSILSGLPLPLMPLQLLWLNLVTNGIQDVALVFEPEEGHELQHPPRKPDEPIFNRLMIERIVVNAIIMGCLAFSVFYWQISMGVNDNSARNVTLLLMVLFENVHVFNSRSESLSIFRQNFFSNPFLLFGMLASQAVHIIAMHTPGLNSMLMLEPVSTTLWTQLLLIALSLIIVDEIHKYLIEHRHS